MNMVARNATGRLDLLTEDLLSMTDAAKELPGRPSASTLFRWRTRGIKGVKLETVGVGGKVFTSRQAIHRFLSNTQA
jgi:hypothetical protein